MFEKQINKYGRKTLESIEKSIWPDKDYGSSMIKRCLFLRKKWLQDFTAEDLRLMLGQDIGTLHLLPFALNILENDLLAEGDYYPGDLLNAVVNIDQKYWIAETKWYKYLYEKVSAREDELKGHGVKIKNFMDLRL